MLEIKGKVNTAICYASIIEEEAIEQIRRMCDYEFTAGSKVRIMPDVHAGKEISMSIPMIDMVRTGQNINRLRKIAGVSVKDLQDVFGFNSPQAIYKWQHGTALPTIDNMVVLARVLGVQIDDILVLADTGISLSA